MLKIIFLLLMSSGIPVAVAMAGSVLVYVLWSGDMPAFVVIHRMASGIDSCGKPLSPATHNRRMALLR